METIILTIVVLVIGVAVGLFVKNSEIGKLEQENITLKSNNGELSATKRENELLKQNYTELKNKIDDLIDENKELHTQLSEAKTKLETYENLQKLIKEDFTQIANEVIKDEQKDLREQNRESVEEKLKPIKESFESLKNKIEEFNKTGIEQSTKLDTNIKNLLNQSNLIKGSADDLANAIKNNAQQRGALGEMILDKLLRQAGLKDKKDYPMNGNYETQKTYSNKNENIKNQRPDVVIDLPEEKHLIIDSKCNLNNFIEYNKSNNEQDLKNFYKDVINSIKDLSPKYKSLEGLNTLNIKLMFIPFESCASYIYSNQEIWDFAQKNDIIIVCPSTLFATLKLISEAWKEENSSKNQQEIINAAANAYNKLVTFVERLEKLKSNFTTTTKTFDDMFKTATGNGGLISQIAKLEELNIHPKKNLDKKYLTNENKTEILQIEE